MTRLRRFAPLVLVAAVLALWLFLGPKIPHDQTVHVVLGNAAPRVTELSVGYARDGELIREATFHWAEGAAPRIVTHGPRLPNGEYRVHIEIASPAKGPARDEKRNERATVDRTVKIEQNPVSIDVQEAVP